MTKKIFPIIQDPLTLFGLAYFKNPHDLIHLLFSSERAHFLEQSSPEKPGLHMQ